MANYIWLILSFTRLETLKLETKKTVLLAQFKYNATGIKLTLRLKWNDMFTSEIKKFLQAFSKPLSFGFQFIYNCHRQSLQIVTLLNGFNC